MTTKEYLAQARHLNALIDSNIKEMEYWRDLSNRIAGSNFEQRYNPNRNIEPPFIRCMEKIIELQQKINDEIDCLVDLKEEIMEAIGRLENTEEKLILKYRYFNCMTWEQICVHLNMSERTVRRVHGQALQNFIVPTES